MITLAPIYTPPRRKTIDDIPTQITGTMAVKLYLLGALLWDYTANTSSTPNMSPKKPSSPFSSKKSAPPSSLSSTSASTPK